MAISNFHFWSFIFFANFLAPIHCHANKHTALFIFGDSFFDSGNNNYINTTTLFQANFFPYGETFFKYPTGRFSDGRLIPDFIAEYANLPLIQPYQQPDNHQFDYGANFASGGAGALVETFPGMVINLKTQLKNFENVEKVLRQKFGDKEAKKMLLNAVYLFSIGSNDYGSPQITNSTIYQSHTQKQYVEMVIGNLTTVIKGNFYPYGETFFKYPSGRYCDGRVIPDFIAEFANLPLLLPYHHPGNHLYDYGVNFASGGSGALVETARGLVLDLKTQLKDFENVEKALRKKFGDKEAKKMLLNAVYLFSVGGNDYGSDQVINSIANSTINQSQYVEMVISNFTAVIKEIYKKGGRKFGFLNVGPISRLPLSELFFPSNCSGCLDELTSLVKLHNSAFSKVLQNLEKQFKGFKYSNFNFYDSLGERIDNPSKYGFKVGNSGCCGTGPNRRINSCGGRRSGIKEYELCDDPSEYIFFDSSHPTEMTNHQMAMLMWSGTPKLTGPYNLKSLFQHTQE